MVTMSTTSQLYLGDCREVLRGLPDTSVDAIVTDPPYEISFMGHGWDASRIAFDREVWSECLRVLKPGGHLMAYGAPKTYHWLACAVEMVGFEVRDMVPWLQGQGMPHGLDVSKAISALNRNGDTSPRGIADAQEAAGCSTPARGETHQFKASGSDVKSGTYRNKPGSSRAWTPDDHEAVQWSGWNTQLAPGHEPAVLARKPLSERNVAENVLRWGVGALNIDGCRLDGGKRVPGGISRTPNTVYGKGHGGPGSEHGSGYDPSVGRWPPNVTLSEAAAARLDAMVGKRKFGTAVKRNLGAKGAAQRINNKAVTHRKADEGYDGSGGPSEFFYVAKAATRERENGCEHLRWAAEDGRFAGRPWREGDDLLVDGKGQPIGNPHPTVKPLALMRWLVRMVTQPGGTVLDPFMGSGTTGVAASCEGMSFIGIDATPWAYTIAESRIRWARGHGPDVSELPPGSPAQASLPWGEAV